MFSEVLFMLQPKWHRLKDLGSSLVLALQKVLVLLLFFLYFYVPLKCIFTSVLVILVLQLLVRCKGSIFPFFFIFQDYIFHIIFIFPLYLNDQKH